MVNRKRRRKEVTERDDGQGKETTVNRKRRRSTERDDGQRKETPVNRNRLRSTERDDGQRKETTERDDGQRKETTERERDDGQRVIGYNKLTCKPKKKTQTTNNVFYLKYFYSKHFNSI